MLFIKDSTLQNTKRFRLPAQGKYLLQAPQRESAAVSRHKLNSCERQRTSTRGASIKGGNQSLQYLLINHLVKHYHIKLKKNLS